jgi:Ca2+-binding RTX toxin-like protein
MVHIRAANSIDSLSGDALTALGPDTLLVDADAFIIAETSGVAARLDGAWTIRINGQVGTFANNFAIDLFSSSGPETSKITIGKTGDVFGGNVALNLGEAVTLTNFGTVTGGFGSASIKANFEAHITNAGTLVGDVLFAEDNDVFTDFKKVGTHIKNGIVVGVIDLDAGDDHFNGGATAETVRDGAGGDTYKFGRGNDTYIAVMDSPGVDGTDIVNGGKGIDTYDASSSVGFFINLDAVAHLVAAHSAIGDTGSDKVTGFENVIGGSSDDIMFGSSGANSLSGGGGADNLFGLGGRDILTGGANGDTFHFTSLSDSGPKASQRDVITDFTQGSPGVGDVIDVSAIDAKAGASNPGDDDFTFIGAQNFHGVKGELRESFKDGNTIVSGDVNGDGHADFSIALKGHLLLSGAPGDDFVL